MASAIIGGMLDSGFKASSIWASAPDDGHLQSIRKRFGISVTTDNRYCAQQADIVVLAVKPQAMADVCRDIAPIAQNTLPLMVSIAAGLGADTLDEWLGGGLPIVRSEEHTSELQSRPHLVCRLLLEKEKLFLSSNSWYIAGDQNYGFGTAMPSRK